MQWSDQYKKHCELRGKLGNWERKRHSPFPKRQLELTRQVLELPPAISVSAQLKSGDEPIVT